jgi:hypothetical protein
MLEMGSRDGFEINGHTKAQLANYIKKSNLCLLLFAQRITSFDKLK